ncbi:hypothetical protein [Pseudomonas lundensis]|uniref:hypothetical protein n=1 Tax=Pseudomonas lundensis TaxID=86185 RepID=UPI001CA3BFC3|nr:hypothetical protein [Pseudomonas lundensis]
MNVRLCCGLSLLMTAALGAEERPRAAVTEARPLLVAALQAADGQAHGVLTGPMAEAISQRFQSSAPILIDVVTERRLPQAGCARLKVSFWQDDVRLPGSNAASRQTLELGIDYCLDGQPPRPRS